MTPEMSWKRFEENWVSLSVTMVSGSPWVENVWRRLQISMVSVVDFNGITSDHFECKSANEKFEIIYRSSKIRVYGEPCSCSFGPENMFLVWGSSVACWHLEHLWTSDSISLSVPGQNADILEIDFMRLKSGWLQIDYCCTTARLSAGGMTTHYVNIKQELTTEWISRCL